MGIFKKLINKVRDTEVPPVVERLVSKELAKKNASSANADNTVSDYRTKGAPMSRP
jgi:hypothetical protein